MFSNRSRRSAMSFSRSMYPLYFVSMFTSSIVSLLYSCSVMKFLRGGICSVSWSSDISARDIMSISFRFWLMGEEFTDAR